MGLVVGGGAPSEGGKRTAHELGIEQSSGFSLGVFLPCNPHRGHVTTFEDVLVVTTGRGYWHVVGGGQGCCPASTTHRTGPTAKKDPAQVSTVPSVGNAKQRRKCPLSSRMKGLLFLLDLGKLEVSSGGEKKHPNHGFLELSQKSGRTVKHTPRKGSFKGAFSFQSLHLQGDVCGCQGKCVRSYLRLTRWGEIGMEQKKITECAGHNQSGFHEFWKPL